MNIQDHSAQCRCVTCVNHKILSLCYAIKKFWSRLLYF